MRNYLLIAAAVFLLPLSINALPNREKEYREYQTIRYDGAGEIIGYAVHDYGPEGLKSETRWYDEKGKQEAVTYYEYNDFNNVIKESVYDRLGETLLSYTAYQYDNGEKKVETSDFGPKGDLRLRIEYSDRYEYGFDSAGERLFRVENTIDEEGRKSGSRVYEYGQEGNEIETSYSTVTYDTDGNTKETAIYAPDGTLLWYMEHKWEAIE